MSTDDTGVQHRRYYHKDDDHGTEFIKQDDGSWWCTHGSWEASILGSDQLTLHHAYGSVTYDRFEVYYK